MNQPWILDIPDTPVFTDDDIYMKAFKTVESKVKQVTEKKKHLYEKYGIQMQDAEAIGPRLNILVMFLFGDDANERLDFESKWLDFVLQSCEQAHNQIEQRVREERAAQIAPKLHMPNGSIHVVKDNDNGQ